MIFMLPLAASAMAAAAPAAMASAASATLGATIMATAKSLAMNLAVSTAMSALQPKVGGAGRMSDWMLDENAPIPFPIGRVGVSGAAVYQKTFGPDLMYKGVVSVLGGAGPIDGYESFKADEEFVTFDGNGKAITSDYANELWLKRTLGTQPDVALTLPPGLKNGGTPFGWSLAHKLSGKPAALHIMGENSKYTAFPTGEIKGLHVLRGLKGWDPRQDSTYPGGFGPCRLNNPATWVYLRRPGLWGLKWSLGLWEGPTLKGAPAHGSETDFQVGGIGAKLSGIDVPFFVALENICDANDWTISGYPSTDDDKHEVLKSILQAGGAVYAQRAGKISGIIRSAPRASVVTITAADTAGEMQLDTGASRIDRLNTIRPQIVSESHGWQLTAIPKVSALAYRSEDGGTRSRGIDYSYVDKATQGAQLAALEIANTREAFAGIVPLKPHLQKIKPGDAFTIDDPEFVLDGQKCLCLNTEYSAETGAVTVTFVSETDAKYPFALGQISTPPEPAELTPEDHVVTPPAPGEWALAAVNFTDGGVSVPVLLFTGDVQNARTESVIFEYRPVGAANWSFAGSEDQTVTRKEAAGGALTAGTAYEGAVSYRVGGRISTRLLLGPVNAGAITAGDVAPVTPANVAGVPSLAVTTTIAPDGTQSSRLWGDFADAADALSYIAEIDDGAIVQQIPLAESAIEDRIVATGPTYRYRVKAVSRTGTLSAAWSAWSNLSTAGGDTTAPGPVTPLSIFGGMRQIAMDWTNPADDDFSHVIIYRDTLGTLGGAVSTARADGSSFVDTTLVVGTTYYYWARTVDRTGNMSAGYTYLGSAAARLTRFDTDLTLIPPRLDPHPIFGGDYMRTDRLIYDGGEQMQALKPLEGGANVTESRTAAAITGQADWATYTGKPISAVQFLTSGGLLGAQYVPYPGDGVYVHTLRPGEAGANVTESRTAAAFTGQGALATKNAAHFFNDTVGRPLVMQDGYFDGGGFFYADAIRNGGVQLNSRWPSEGGANVTENRTAAAIAGQTSWATLNVPTTHLTRPGSNLLFNGGISLGIQGFVGPSVYGYDAETGHYIYFNASGRITDIHRCTPGQTMTLSGETFANAPGALIYLVFWGDVGLTDYKGEGAYFGANGYVRSAATPVVVPAGATYWTIHSYCPDWSAGLMVIRKIKVENGNAGTPWSDEATNGALYRGGGTIDSLKPQEPGANVTETRNAAAITGQTAWATLPRNPAAISKIDDTGRITDGQALPLNGMSKSSTLSPAYPFSAGTDPATQINIAAATATFAGGSTLSFGSATLSGLAASTYYSIFRDLQTGSYVAISGSTTPYFTSAQRYLYIGTQATQEVGGGYEELPPPPPGSGGGYGDIPLYVPA